MEPGTSLHFIGIGGIGVSAVARIAIGKGYRVSGSDVRRSQLTDAMAELGARVHIGHDASHIDGVDVVVVSTAIPDHNVELAAAKARGTRLLHRSELLAAFLSEGQTVGVTGTHGKGTTSSMITRILDAAGRDPGFIIGGLLLDYGVNARAGGGDLIVAEVDESDGSHRNVKVQHLVCNYLEADHLNYYDDLDHIIRSMADAVRDNPRLERLYVNWECPGNHRLVNDELAEAGAAVVTYGVCEGADVRGEIIGDAQRPIRFRAWRRGEALGEFELSLPGRYNVTNALGAMAVAMELGAPVEAVRRALADFQGLENRFTIVDAGGVILVKDYNSHPTAMRKVLASARDLSEGKVYSVFKPYRYTLTNYLKDEYATAFRGSDQVVITTMYAANEDPIPGIDTNFFVNMLREQGHDVVLVEDQDRITDYLHEQVRPGDQVMFFGGDDFFRMADAWAERLRAEG